MRHFLPAVAVTVLGLFVAGFTLKDGAFTVEVPDGWLVEAKDAEGVTTTKPANDSDGTNCNFYFVDRASIKGPQSALNKEYATPFSDAQWNDFLSTKAEDTEITERVVVDIGGKFLQIATLEIPAKQIKARIGFIVTPGRVFDAGCYARTGRFEAFRPTFEKLVRSLRPS